MRTSIVNLYRFDYEDKTPSEEVSAENISTALSSLAVPDSEVNPVIRVTLLRKGITTVVPDIPSSVAFTAKAMVGQEEKGGSVGCSSGTACVGDSLTFVATPAPYYVFSGWFVNGSLVSLDREFTYVFTDSTTKEFVAQFSLAPITFKTAISPATASATVFPASQTLPAGGDLKLYASAESPWTFSHWERNGQTVSTDPIPSNLVLSERAEGEEEVIYTACFTS